MRLAAPCLRHSLVFIIARITLVTADSRRNIRIECLSMIADKGELELVNSD